MNPLKTPFSLATLFGSLLGRMPAKSRDAAAALPPAKWQPYERTGRRNTPEWEARDASTKLVGRRQARRMHCRSYALRDAAKAVADFRPDPRDEPLPF